ncbi:TRAP transporter substrate-binding protein [Mariluticola halotolerans]|uniref:TRAP transporter substrate-binding protein n=1 Tax=Mariluticola halotolerans TaxID=2909283 RepID=UPI0026E3F613|nr:TRAP transporter substrate-binding protein [Mariluticola halotolerans]UJQ95086.1 TRAP transporter substrate-binding protein [Mariluticola halotolerans]
MNALRTAASLTAICAMLAAQPALAQDMRARLAHVFATNSPVDQASQAFAQCVTDGTDGAMDVTVFPNSQLGSDESIGRDLSRGGIEFAFLNPGSLTGLDPLLDIHYLPYIVSSNDEADAVFYNPDGILQTTIRETLDKHGMKALDFFELEFRAVTNSERAVESLADMKDLRLRVPGSVAIRSFFEQAGTQAVTLPFPELFVALQQGTVDGQDNGASITYNSRLFEAQKYMTRTNHVYAMGTITVGNEFWEGLSEDRQTLIADCAHEAASNQIADNRAQQAEFIQNIKDGGVEVTELSADAMAEFVELGRSLWTQLEDAYGADRIAALRAEVGADGK